MLVGLSAFLGTGCGVLFSPPSEEISEERRTAQNRFNGFALSCRSIHLPEDPVENMACLERACMEFPDAPQCDEDVLPIIW